jgi:hypothetical protein
LKDEELDVIGELISKYVWCIRSSKLIKNGTDKRKHFLYEKYFRSGLANNTAILLQKALFFGISVFCSIKD